MRFPPQFLDELRARLPVSDVVGRRVKLKKSGREWKGLSPFNKERTPSFFVNDQKGFYHDFSSGKHGDIFGFVMDTEGVTFPEAVERLAALAGLAVPKMTEEAEAQEHRRRTLHDVVELAAKFFEATLASRAGAKARGYLADRALDPATQLKFRIGYAPPDRFALKEHLGALGVSNEDMIEAGLLIAGDDIPLPYDRFRDRVMFPISDLAGRVIAFGGRALEKDVPAKYLNSPETPLFHKGATLYNGQVARQAAHQGAQVIAVEGYVDVIAMVTAGFSATVAPLGTALTEDQLALLWKMSDEPILCFDGDEAGQRAAFRAVDLALPRLKPGKSLLFAGLPDGQDPDDLVRSGGKGAVADVLAGARPLAEMLWMRETATGRFDTPERRAGLEARINTVTAGIAHEAVRKYYRQDLETRLRGLFAPPARAGRPGGTGRYQDRMSGRQGFSGQGFGQQGFGQQGFRDRFAKRAGRGGFAEAEPANLTPLSPRLASSSIVRGSRSALPAREALILLALVNHPWLLDTHSEEVAELEFQNSDADLLRRAILDAAHVHAGGEPLDDLRGLIAEREHGALLARIERALTHAADWPARPGAAADDVRQWWTHLVALHRKTRSLNRELKDAERALGDDPSEQNLAWLLDVQGRLSAIDGTEASIEGFGVLSGRPVRNL
jgi:DNA primase